MGNYVDTFHPYSLLNEINLYTYVSPSTDIDTSSIGYLWHIIKCPKFIYVESPAPSDRYAIREIFRTRYESL